MHMGYSYVYFINPALSRIQTATKQEIERLIRYGGFLPFSRCIGHGHGSWSMGATNEMPTYDMPAHVLHTSKVSDLGFRTRKKEKRKARKKERKKDSRSEGTGR